MLLGLLHFTFAKDRDGVIKKRKDESSSGGGSDVPEPSERTNLLPGS